MAPSAGFMTVVFKSETLRAPWFASRVLPATLRRASRSKRRCARQQTELRVLFDLTPAMICFKDTNNRILRVNKRFAEILGKSVEEIEGKSILEIDPQEAEKVFADDLEVIHSGTPKLGIIETIRDRKGQAIWVQTDKVPVFDKDGR